MTQTTSVGDAEPSHNKLFCNSWLDLCHSVFWTEQFAESRSKNSAQGNEWHYTTVNREGMEDTFVRHTKTIGLNKAIMECYWRHKDHVIYSHFISSFHLGIADRAQQGTRLMMLAHGITKESPKQKMEKAYWHEELTMTLFNTLSSAEWKTS